MDTQCVGIVGTVQGKEQGTKGGERAGDRAGVGACEGAAEGARGGNGCAGTGSGGNSKAGGRCDWVGVRVRAGAGAWVPIRPPCG